MDSLETKLVSAKDLIDYCKHYIELYKGTQTDKARRDELYAVIGQIVNMPSAQPENEFLDFLWNVINPNDMEKYLSMYHSKEECKNE